MNHTRIFLTVKQRRLGFRTVRRQGASEKTSEPAWADEQAPQRAAQQAGCPGVKVLLFCSLVLVALAGTACQQEAKDMGAKDNVKAPAASVPKSNVKPPAASGPKTNVNLPATSGSNANAKAPPLTAGPRPTSHPTRVTKIAFIGKKEACDCTRKRVKDSLALLQTALHDRTDITVEQLQVDVDQAAVEPYQKLRPIMVLPAIYFLDGSGALVKVLLGEVTEEQVQKALGV